MPQMPASGQGAGIKQVDQIRVGLIGAGALGAVHAANLASVPGCRFTAVASADVTPTAAAAVAAARADTVEVGAMFDPGYLDAVIVATPTDSHAEYVRRAVSAGLSVFCEKPLARTPDEADDIRDLAERRGVKVAVGHVVRYFPEYAAARDLVHGGGLGTGVIARLARLNRGPGDLSAWYTEQRRSGGVLLDMAVHDVDWCLWAFGPARRVYAVHAGDGGGQVASVTIRHAGGAISYIDSSWREDGFSTRLEISGTEGLYTVEGSGSAGFEPTRAASSSYLPPGAQAPSVQDPYALELRAAIAWFRGGPPPLATVAEACEAVRVVAAAQTSVDTRRPVTLIGAAA